MFSTALTFFAGAILHRNWVCLACSGQVGRCLAGVAHSSLDSVQGSTVSFRAEALRHICDLRLIGQFEKEGGLGWDAYYT